MGAHAIAIDPMRLGPAGQHRAQQTRPHLDGFFNHVILPGMFERREQIMQIGMRFLCPGHFLNDECHLLAARGCDSRIPFAVTAIKHKNRVAISQAQHIADIICLHVIKIDLHRLRKGCVDIQALGGKIIAGHAAARYE